MISKKLIASGTLGACHFGTSVAISRDVIVIGASLDDTAGKNCGSALVYRFNGTAWRREQKLTAADPAEGDWFGSSVDIAGDVIVVGAHGNDDAGSYSGAAYVFRFDGTDWVEERKLTAFDAVSIEQAGYACGRPTRSSILMNCGSARRGSQVESSPR